MSITSLPALDNRPLIRREEELHVLALLDRPAWAFDVDARRFWWANPAAVDAWGAPSLEALREREFPTTGDAGRERYEQLRQRLYRGERFVERYVLYHHQCPQPFDCNLSGLTLPNGHLGLLAVAEFHQRGELDGMAERGLEVIRHMSGMVTVYDEHGAVVYQNASADRAYGPPATSPLLRERFAASQGADQLLTQLQATGSARTEAFACTAAGEAWHAVELRLAPDPATGRPSILEIREDITDRRRAQEALREAKEMAEAADRAKSAFLANMSHELRTPLNAIIGYAELLIEEVEESDVPPWYGQDLDRILRAGNHLLGLINNVLDLSKIEAGQMELFIERCRLERLVEDVVATIRPLAEANRNRVLVHLPAAPRPVMVDETRLRQILVNLLGNACKFTREGDISVTVEQLPGRVEFTVADTGIGMGPDELDRIFKPFAQSDASVSARYGGTGLGLTICRNFCEMMGGHIDVRSEQGVGSAFTVVLPLSCEA